MDHHNNSQRLIEQLQYQLGEKEKLLEFTRSYADRLLSQVNTQVESIQAQQDLLEHQHRQLIDSIECAKQVLSVVTTSHQELQAIYPESFLLFRPKDLIGGDFFWMHTLGDLVFIAAGDCTGHGVSGGILSLMGDMLLRQAVIEHDFREPSQILAHIDKTVSGMTADTRRSSPLGANTVADIAIDMLVAVHDTARGEIHISSAHMPFFLWQDGQLQRHKGGRSGIGVSKKHKSFDTVSLALQEDTIIYFTSDGFADQFQKQENERNKKFGRAQMMQLLEAVAPEDLTQQQAEITHALEAWMKGTPQTDDIMMMGIKYGSFCKSTLNSRE